jgi:hypothetical protein
MKRYEANPLEADTAFKKIDSSADCVDYPDFAGGNLSGTIGQSA